MIVSTHSKPDALTISSKKYRQEIVRFFLNMLEADLGEAGDITTKFLEIEMKPTEAVIRSKSNGLIAGVDELEYFFGTGWSNFTLFFSKKIKVEFYKKDGQKVRKNEILMRLSGTTGDILKVERTILNFLQRMSGIATATDLLLQKVGNKIIISSTRKTVWGLLDKKACVVGGGDSHRLGLYDAILIKDTHLKIYKKDFMKIFEILAKNLKKSFQNKKNLDQTAPYKPDFIEIEVENGSDAVEVAKAHESYFKDRFLRSIPFWIMLDNMSSLEISKIVKIIKKRFSKTKISFEASGGINFDNINAYAKTGVDLVSIGAITHSVKALDFSLKIV